MNSSVFPWGFCLGWESGILKIVASAVAWQAVETHSAPLQRGASHSARAGTRAQQPLFSEARGRGQGLRGV
eukprot:CAMPEP_0175312938 /NCGR_PEP_ID=MMETSP0093-20121207/67620_1 /TAXON_ID=311494 /ORGANISM="Alexandrium monilatum, Strain CCMP3105" /LENGTH=70 /DNA_ID=CAMNT_0016609617 /DNA_START=9 /DNA_END=218 /DNA_ORIENTATION=+